MSCLWNEAKDIRKHKQKSTKSRKRLRKEPVVSVENPTLIPTDPCAGVLCTELATRGSESATIDHRFPT